VDGAAYTTFATLTANDTPTFDLSTAVTIGGDSIVSLAGTQTLSNKTLTAPKFADLGFIADANGNELIILDTVTSAVNEITLANAATTTNPSFTASGGDANVGINFVAKGAEAISIRGNATQAGELRIYEDTDDGTNYSAFRGSARAGSITYTLPTADPTAGQVLSAGAPSGGVSALSWATAGGGGAVTLVDYDTQASTGSVQFTGLDLETDGLYKVTVKVKTGSDPRNLFMRINGDSSGVYQSNVHQSYNSGATDADTTEEQLNQSSFELNYDAGGVTGANYKMITAELIISKVSGEETIVGGTVFGTDLTGSSSLIAASWRFIGQYNSTTNLTQMDFYYGAPGSTVNAAWQIWVHKYATS
ncbi:MAG TPA: hypothetical protein VEA37_11975, partial [Flavobacterium sp.]|nr:hypothetical protein [Flavobacterium sp.]